MRINFLIKKVITFNVIILTPYLLHFIFLFVWMFVINSESFKFSGPVYIMRSILFPFIIYICGIIVAIILSPIIIPRKLYILTYAIVATMAWFILSKERLLDFESSLYKIFLFYDVILGSVGVIIFLIWVFYERKIEFRTTSR